MTLHSSVSFLVLLGWQTGSLGAVAVAQAALQVIADLHLQGEVGFFIGDLRLSQYPSTSRLANGYFGVVAVAPNTALVLIS